MNKDYRINKMNSLNRSNKIILFFVLLFLLFFIILLFINIKNKNKESEIKIDTEYVENISSREYDSESEFVDSIKSSGELYKSYNIGFSYLPNESDPLYSVSYDYKSKVNYFEFGESNSLIRVVYQINSDNISSLTLINKDELNNWIDFDTLQENYSKDKNISDKNKINKMLDNNDYLAN